MRNLVELQVDAKAIKDLTNGYPLILKDAIVTSEVNVEEGTLIHLVDKNGGYIATGYYGAQNKGIGWVLSRKEKEAIDAKFLQQKFVMRQKNARNSSHQKIHRPSVYLTARVTVSAD